MSHHLETVLNVLLDRSAQEWVEGLGVALFLALVLAGAYAGFRRWTKVQDETAPLAGLAMITIFAGMVIAALHAELKPKWSASAGPAGDANVGVPGGPGRGPGGGGPGRGFGGGSTRMAGLIFDNADADHDGLLSTEEAVDATAKFIAEVDVNKKGAIDRDALIAVLRERLRPPGTNPPPAPAPDPATRPPA